MIEFNEAVSILKKHKLTLSEIEIPLIESIGKYTSQDIFATNNVPSFNNSAMDGYAIKFDENVREFCVSETIQAGYVSSKKFISNECARIFTGAVVPEFFDTVIQQELIEKVDNKIFFKIENIKKGSNIRKIGEQHKIGNLLVPKNTKINPAIISLLATDGIEKLKVFKTPNVKLIVTGNELIELGKPLENGKIYNSNQFLITGYFKEKWVENFNISKIEDNALKIQQELRNSVENYDLVILTGGISVGDYDFVKESIEKIEADTLFYKVKQKPGKPFCVAQKNKSYIFAFPGNPSSVLSCLYTYLNPFIEQSFGNENAWNFEQSVLKENYIKKSRLTFILKAFYDSNTVTILDGQESFNLSPFAKANCLVILESEKQNFEKGNVVKIIKI